MSRALDYFVARATTEEGRRKLAYNDATDKTVSCRPGGNLSIGIGINLENGLDDEEIDWLLHHRAELTEALLTRYDWYMALDPLRQSVMIDIAFNEGLNGLLHFPKMIAALAAKDYQGAATECRIADAKIDAQRYAPLRELLLTGGPT